MAPSAGVSGLFTPNQTVGCALTERTVCAAHWEIRGKPVPPRGPEPAQQTRPQPGTTSNHPALPEKQLRVLPSSLHPAVGRCPSDPHWGRAPRRRRRTVAASLCPHGAAALPQPRPGSQSWLGALFWPKPSTGDKCYGLMRAHSASSSGACHNRPGCRAPGKAPHRPARTPSRTPALVPDSRRRRPPGAPGLPKRHLLGANRY